MTQPKSQPSSGLVLIDKPSGITSHDVVARLRKVLATRRVGHAGTLDPMATGLLVLGVEAGTKLLNYLTGADKTYLATIRLGWATTTDDAEGERLPAEGAAGHQVSVITDEELTAALQRFQGAQEQVPSSVSAVRIDGKRAYDLVRAGVEVKLEPRRVEIYDFELLSKPRRNSEPEYIDIDVRVSCSSGTYIRALARDLGDKFGVGGHLVALRRTKVGPFDIQDASDILTPLLIPLSSAASQLMPFKIVNEAEAADLRLGRQLSPEPQFEAGQIVAAVGSEDKLVAVVQVVPSGLQPRWVVTERS